MGKPLSRPDCLRQNPACLGKGEEEDGYIEDCYVPQRSIYDTMRINEQIDQGCKLSQPSKSTMDRVEIGTLSSNGTLGTSYACDAKAQDCKKLDERVIFDALKLSNDTLKSAPVPPRRRPNADRKDNINRRSWKAFIPPNFPDFAERIEASLSEVSEAGTSNHSLHDKTEFSQLLPDSTKHSSCEQTESISSTSSHLRPPAPSSALSGDQRSEHHTDSRCQHVQSFDDYNDSEYEQDPLLTQENTLSVCTRSKPGHNFPSATWPRALKSFIKGSLSDGHQKAAGMAYEECVIETLPLSPCLSDEVLDESSNLLIVPNLRQKTESELKFEEDELKILMEVEEEWEDMDSAGACHSVTVCDGNMEERGVIASNEGSPDKTWSVSNLEPFPGDTVMPEPSPWPGTSGDYSCCSAVSAGNVTRRYQKLGSYSDSESDTDSDQLFLEMEQECLTGGTDEPAELCESVPDADETEVNAESPPHVEPGNNHTATQEVSRGPQQDHTYSKAYCIDSMTTDIACHSAKSSPVPDEQTPAISPQLLFNTCSAPEADDCYLEEVVSIANAIINETCADLAELPSLQVAEWPKCITPSSNEVLGLPESSEQLDVRFAHSITELVLEGVEETPAPLHVPHTESCSPVCDLERDSCLGSSEQPDESWTCEASFQSTDIIPADSYDEGSDGGELTVSTTHACSSLPDDSLQSSTSASELQELPDETEEISSGNQIKNVLFELAADNGITIKLSKSTTLQVIDQNVIEIVGCASDAAANGVTIFTCSEEINGSIDGEAATVIPLEDVSTELLVVTDTLDHVPCDRSWMSPETEDHPAQASFLSSENLEDEQDSRTFSGLNSLSLEASASHESGLKDDFTGPLSALAQTFLTPGEIAEEHYGLASSEGNSIAVLQEVTLSCSEIDTSPHGNVEYRKTVQDSSSTELNGSAQSIIESSENYCKDTVSSKQANEEQWESPEPSPSQGDTEFELAYEGLSARVHLSDLSDSCSLSVNTRDNSLASREEGGASAEIICTGQCDHDPATLSSTTEVTNTVLLFTTVPYLLLYIYFYCIVFLDLGCSALVKKR